MTTTAPVTPPIMAAVLTLGPLKINKFAYSFKHILGLYIFSRKLNQSIFQNVSLMEK